MSDDYHRPTYTAPRAQGAAQYPHGAYNATQVRLYGIPGLSGNHSEGKNDGMECCECDCCCKCCMSECCKCHKQKCCEPDKAASVSEPQSTSEESEIDTHAKVASQKHPTPDVIDVITIGGGNFAIAGFATKSNDPRNDETLGKKSSDPRNDETLSTLFSKLRQIPNLQYINSSWVFINTKIRNFMITLGAMEVGTEKPTEKLTSGIIFGYAYEGHCYDLPKPKIMLIPADPECIPPDDCGYDLKTKAHYRVWIVDKLDQCIELDMNQGFIEQIVLDANLPGKRSPSMYAAKFQMAHRSGRLSE